MYSDSYPRRPDCFMDTSRQQWESWRWQQQHALRRGSDVLKYFPNATATYQKLAEGWEQKGLRFQLTPYMLSLGKKDKLGNPGLNDPIFKQFLPSLQSPLIQIESHRPDEYSPGDENWENPYEMLTPILQHKYPHKALLLLNDTCMGYCLYCFRSLASEAVTEKHGGLRFWKETVSALSVRTEINELIISGGDPLAENDERLEHIFADIRRVRPNIVLRIHTRALTHNPYRITPELCQLLHQFNVGYIGIQVAHPAEISSDFIIAALRMRHEHRGLCLFAQFPLLKGVNDELNVMEQLCTRLYTNGIVPKYCFHNMPNTPAAAELRTSVRRGAEIFQQLQGRVGWLPRYVIASQKGGKITVPLDPCGSPLFKYETSENDWPVVRAFSPLINDWVIYQDSP
jgi:lysine 2,3-aminomutase